MSTEAIPCLLACDSVPTEAETCNQFVFFLFVIIRKRRKKQKRNKYKKKVVNSPSNNIILVLMNVVVVVVVRVTCCAVPVSLSSVPVDGQENLPDQPLQAKLA